MCNVSIPLFTGALLGFWPILCYHSGLIFILVSQALFSAFLAFLLLPSSDILIFMTVRPCLIFGWDGTQVLFYFWQPYQPFLRDYAAFC